MKKELKKKLSLNKIKIAGLNKETLATIKGGVEFTDAEDCYPSKFKNCLPSNAYSCETNNFWFLIDENNVALMLILT